MIEQPQSLNPSIMLYLKLVQKSNNIFFKKMDLLNVNMLRLYHKYQLAAMSSYFTIKRKLFPVT